MEFENPENVKRVESWGSHIFRQTNKNITEAITKYIPERMTIFIEVTTFRVHHSLNPKGSSANRRTTFRKCLTYGANHQTKRR